MRNGGMLVFISSEFGKISPACRSNSPQSPLQSSRKAANFSSPRTTNRFPSSRCASAIQIVRPAKSRADTQPQLHPALLRLSAMISQYFKTRHRNPSGYASAASTFGKIRKVRSSREISKIERMVSCRPLRKNLPPYPSTSCMARISAATPALSM